MDVETITMEPNVARETLREYRTAIHKKADAEYQSVIDGLEHLADNHALISLPSVISGAPRDDKLRPMLAIGRADRRQVHFQWRNSRSHCTFDTSSSFTLNPPSLVVDVDMGEELLLPKDEGGFTRWTTEGFTLVPLVPPAAKKSHALNKCWVLWEVEAWADKRIGAQPDRDPLLVQPLGGDLWAVIGEWDLTDLERAVMAGRARV